MLKPPLPLVLLLFCLLTIYVRAELSAEHQEKIAELWEAAFTSPPSEWKQHVDAAQEYSQQNQLNRDDVHDYQKSWVKENWQRIYRYTITALDDNPLESTSDPDVATGKRLPHEFISGWYALNIFEDMIRPRSADSYFNIIRVSSLLGMAKDTLGIDTVPILLKPNSNSLPPTKRDLAIANSTSLIIIFMEQQYGYFTGTTVDAWEPLIDSQNPLYRFLALWGISISIPKDLQQYSVGMGRSYEIFYLSRRSKFELYKRFFDDECLEIKLRLYQYLGGCHFPESHEYLKAEKARWEAIPDEEDVMIELQVPNTFYSPPASKDPFAPAQPTPPTEKKTKEISPRDTALAIINESIKQIEEENATMPEKYRKMIEVYEQTGRVIEVDE